MNRRIARLSFSLVWFTSLCFAIATCQDAPPPRPALPRPQPGMAMTTIHFGQAIGHMGAVTGAPYCADEVYEHKQTLADGTHITSKERVIRQCRDSAGRTRREEPIGAFGPFGRGTESPILIHIDDPVAKVRYILDPQNKIAHRQASAQEGEEPAQGAPRIAHHAPVQGPRMETTSRPAKGQDELQPRFTSEDLGKETIEGIIAQGRRTTTTYPVGAVGNDKEFATTNEYWMSSELKLDVLSKTIDPRSGEDTRKMINISTNEPDPALFGVPEGYTVSDDEEFRVEWRMHPPAPQ